MNQFASDFLTPTALLLLTLGAFLGGLKVYEKCGRNALLHPITISSVVIASVLSLSGIDYTDYVDANQVLYFLLGPTTVALAIPLYREFHHIRRLAKPIIILIASGSLLAPACAILIAWILGANDLVVHSLLPKSVTTPIAIGIAESVGGLATLTTGVVVFTGIIGTIASPLVFRLLKLNDSKHQGLILGLNAHGIGTARAFDVDGTSGAFATLAMGLTGAFSALTLPYLATLLS